MSYKTDDLRIVDVRDVVPYAELQAEFPITDEAARTTHDARESIHRILHGDDDRLLVVVGPCSIHDPRAALDYARQLKAVRDQNDGLATPQASQGSPEGNFSLSIQRRRRFIENHNVWIVVQSACNTQPL